MQRSNSLRGKYLKNILGLRFAGAAAVTLFAFLPATLARAAADTAHPSRLHRAHPTESAAAAKSSKPKSSQSSAAHSAKPVPRNARSSSRSAAQNKPVQSKPVQSKSAQHSHHRAQEQENDPPVMHHAHSTPRSRAAEQRHVAQMLAEARTLPPATNSPQISAQPPLAAKTTLTTQDFMRAAGETPATEAIVAPATNSAPAPQPQSQRIDGFGAEGATLASSRHYVPPTTLPPPSQVDPEDPELASLAHQSHEELAESALQPRLPNLYASNGRLIVPAPLIGSHDVLVHQNEMADAEGLSRIENDEQLASLRAKHLLVDYPESASLQLNPELPDNRRCGRPWAVKFATDMARAYYARFHQPLQINSAVRTIQYQRRLERVNGNAAGTDGEGASPHLTGQAIDFGKRGMSITQIAWMRAYLKPLIQAGKLDVEEEFHQACFHISVYRSYVSSGKSTPREVAQVGNTGEK